MNWWLIKNIGLVLSPKQDKTYIHIAGKVIEYITLLFIHSMIYIATNDNIWAYF